MLFALPTVQQGAIADCLSFDPFACNQNGLATSEIDVGGRQVADALVISQVDASVIHAFSRIWIVGSRPRRPDDLAVPGETHEGRRHRAIVRALRCDASAIRLPRHVGPDRRCEPDRRSSSAQHPGREEVDQGRAHPADSDSANHGSNPGPSARESASNRCVFVVSSLAGIVLKLPRVSYPAKASAATRDAKCLGAGARTAAGSLEAVFESSDVERFGWILMEVLAAKQRE